MYADLERRLLDFVNDEIAMVDAEIEADTELLLSGAIDSLGVIRITQWIEDESGVSIDPGDVTLENFQTVGAMMRYLDARAAA